MTDNKPELAAALRPIVSRVRTDATCVKRADGAQAWTREALTDERLLRHLNGGPARGVCPIKAGEAVTMLALLDLDSHKGETPWPAMVAEAERISAGLEAVGLRAIPFRSSGGRGIHLFMLWEQPQDAYSVRRLLGDVLASLGLRNGAKGVQAGEVEVFPKQDQVAADGFGNQFILPLAGASVPLEPIIGFEAMSREYVTSLDWPMSDPVPVVERPVREALPAASSVELATLRSALAAIPNDGPGLGYDEWRNVIFAIHCETAGSDEGLALAHEFSARSDKYDAGFLDARVWPYITARDGAITGRTVLAMAAEHGWQEDVSGLFDDVRPRAADGETPAPQRKVGIPEAKHLTTDQANAVRIVRRYGKRLLVAADKWHAWTGTHWAPLEGEVYRMAMQLSRLIHDEAAAWLAKPADSQEEREKNQGIAEALAKWAAKSEMKGAIEAALALARKMLTIPPEMVDADPDVLNCANGTVELRTGKLRPHNPDDYITKLAPVAYNPDAGAPAWLTVLQKVTMEEGEEHAPVAEFLQRWFGYCATGRTREQKFAVHHGGGSNGKSTIIDTVTRVLGGYAATAAPGLMVSAGRERHPTEIADLFGRRMVTAHETGDGGVLREDFIKQATGGDRIKARYMRADFFEFSPTHKLQLLTNYKPIIKGQDEGIWRRVMLVPYRARFGSADEVARGLATHAKTPEDIDRLEGESEGVLAWLVAGAVAWYRDGLNPPDAVLAASKDYQVEQDRLRQFVSESCELGVEHVSRLSDVYANYCEWAKSSGYHSLAKNRMLQELERVVPGFAKFDEFGEGQSAKRRRFVALRGLRLLDAL